MKFFLVLLVCVGLGACAWIKPTARSETVQLATDADIVNCVKKGITSSKTIGRIIFIPRNREKVFNELVTLAKNEAAVMQGDTVVANGKPQGGALDFVVYRCR